MLSLMQIALNSVESLMLANIILNLFDVNLAWKAFWYFDLSASRSLK